MILNIVLWVILGLIAGWVASVIMGTRRQQGTGTDIVLGILGAVLGGLVMSMFGASGITGFNIYSLLVATLGAAVLIYLRRLMTT